MAYDGYIRYGTTEVINLERLAAYIANGIAPLGTRIDVEAREGLAEVLTGPSWTPYRTPIQDEPPWYDADDSDTWDFAGVLPLEVTGLDDTTRTIEVAQTLTGDGLPGRVQRAPRTVGVTALLVGRTTAGVNAGFAWLQRVLAGACDSDEQPCGPAADLAFLTYAPDEFAPSAATSESLTVTVVANTTDEVEAWVITNAAVDGPLTVGDLDLMRFDPYDSIAVLDGGDADGEGNDGEIYDGGGADPAPDLLDGGDASTFGTGIVSVPSGPNGPCNNGPITVTFTGVIAREANVNVQMVLLNSANEVFEYGPKVTLPDPPDPWPGDEPVDTIDLEWDLPFGVTEDVWRAALIFDGTFYAAEAQVTAYPMVGPEACVAGYRRFLPVTATTSGPTPTGTIDADCAVLMEVEWVWVSGSPYRYGVTDPVLLGLGWGDPPTLDAPGVTWDAGDGSTLISATPWNCTPPAPVAGCAIDPGAPAFGNAPALPILSDPTRPRITTQNVRSVWALVGPEQTPSNDGVFTIDLAAGAAPVVGVRVRVWDDANADGTVPDNCDFAYEYLVDYVPANGVLTIDGTSNQILTMCAGNAVPQDASPGVRGDFGGPIKTPVARCNRRYLFRVQWLDTYPKTALPYYTAGQPNGDLTVNLHVTTREG